MMHTNNSPVATNKKPARQLTDRQGNLYNGLEVQELAVPAPTTERQVFRLPPYTYSMCNRRGKVKTNLSFP